MEVEICDPEIESMAFDPAYKGKWPVAIVRAVRKVINIIMQATDRNDLYQMHSLRLKKRQGEEYHQIRINDQYRFLLEFKDAGGKEIISIIEMGDLH